MGCSPSKQKPNTTSAPTPVAQVKNANATSDGNAPAQQQIVTTAVVAESHTKGTSPTTSAQNVTAAAALVSAIANASGPMLAEVLRASQKDLNQTPPVITAVSPDGQSVPPDNMVYQGGHSQEKLYSEAKQ